ncbi:hypothetical protein ZIOFF_036983 [Zingiber officinale]|uniref:Exocyst complex component Sec10-like alpha-helical bundle domain-containing protein n=1 Tax=Zingiber officinale TaxID=94328 RepID=A0A8J5GB30_ZINOF|nr:hypothetical protein ZIOFF_036983 [Zingiber officinale]
MASPKASAATLPLILDVEDFKGDFSFDALFGGLVNELLPSFQDDNSDAADSTGATEALQNGTLRGPQGLGTPMFPAVEELLALFKDSCKEIHVIFWLKIDGRLQNLKKEVEVQDAKHRKTLAEVKPTYAFCKHFMQYSPKQLHPIQQLCYSVPGLMESLFLSHKDEYPEYEQASLKQLYQSKMEELRAEAQQQSESTGTISRSKTTVSPPSQQISVTIVTEFVRWNEEAITRCTVFSSQPLTLASNVRSVFACLLEQVSRYLTEGLERARESLNEAASLRDRFVIGASVSRRVAAAAASAVCLFSCSLLLLMLGAEAAATAGESSFRSFMIAVQRCASSIAILQQYFSNTISRLLAPDAHAACLEEMGTAVSRVESSAQKGLQQCIETVMAEVSICQSLTYYLSGLASSDFVEAVRASTVGYSLQPGSDLDCVPIDLDHNFSSCALICSFPYLRPGRASANNIVSFNYYYIASKQASAALRLFLQVERLLSSEQKTTDYRTPDDGNAPDHRPTNACIRVVGYLSRVLESAFNALEGLNKQSFLTDLGNRLHKGLVNHWQKFTFSPSGGLRLKRDITEYGEFVRSFSAPSIDEKFELLGIVANCFIVAPESLASLFEGTPSSIRKDALRFIQLREDFKTAKISSMLHSFMSDS